MDYKDFKIDMNMKTLMLYEEMSGKSFYEVSIDDFEMLVYCAVVVNNQQNLTFSQFQLVMKNQKISRVLYEKCQRELDFITQFQREQKDKKEEKGETGRITDIINTLILQYNVDVNYVMKDMKLWELSPLVKAMDDKTKADMVDKRFWTYMNILPHIDGRKIKSPEKLLPFPWETEAKKQDSIKFMEDNQDAIKAFFNKNKDNE